MSLLKVYGGIVMPQSRGGGGGGGATRAQALLPALEEDRATLRRRQGGFLFTNTILARTTVRTWPKILNKRLSLRSSV